MSGEGKNRKNSNRTVSVCSNFMRGLILIFAMLFDAVGTCVLLFLVNDGDFTQFSFKDLLLFSYKSYDLVILLLVRIVSIAVIYGPVINFLSFEEDAPEGEDEDEEGENSNQYAAVPAHDLDDTEDEYNHYRQRSLRRSRNYKIKTIVLFSFFILFTICNVIIAVKCLYFKFARSPIEEILMAITVLWVNVEIFSLDGFLDSVVGGEDIYKPMLHPHGLRFNHNVHSTKCDVCNQRIIKESFECVMCDFDCCLVCFRRRTMVTAENNLTRGDRGVNTEDQLLSPLSYIWRSFSFLVPFWKILFLSLACLTLNQCIGVVLPNFQGKVLDSIIGEDMSQFWYFIKLYCVLSVCTLVLGSVRSFGSMLVMRNLTMGIREKLFSKLIYRDISFYDGCTVGSLTARMTNDVQATVQPVNTLLNTILSNSITLVGGIFMCFTVSWRLAMISLTVVGPIVYITSAYAKWSARINRGVWDALAQANSTATEAFSNIRTVRSFSTEEHEKEKFTHSMTEALSKTLRDAIAYSGMYLATSLMDRGASAVLLGFGGYMVITRPDELSLGQLVTFQLYANMMNSAYKSLNGVLNQFTTSAGAAERVLSMLDGEPDIDPTKGDELLELKGKIEMKDVKFHYQMRPDRTVLNQLNLCFPPNSVSAIVGRSGGGKSTLMHLILRFYDPQEGQVLIDGHDLKTLSLPWLHHQFAVVAQDTQLFNTSIEENIAYGLESYTPEEVRRAAMDANAHDFIEGFPEGYKTHVGERGVRLSGGQRQRIAIARALLRKPRVLLLDEATSALDSESEALVQRALDQLIVNLSQSCTIIVIAHRLSTIVNANNIVVLDGGRVAEQGTHEDLLKTEGPYWRLVNRQLRDGKTTLDFDEEATNASKEPKTQTVSHKGKRDKSNRE
ncbi:ABC transporter transmembrane region 2/ABC transporter transmembrane region/ABC transporter, putative [Angomonas deanei]|uniref:ABC transporter transmembrane region 2/ABC transporter transmembrane region/ABC transporter, putative n=1 Tax=Angomonas deanei TaxID=59799 RepID=A0A7G2CKT9_9TRYP|nr:ABC transporter transmembrane region 2/ABC transporter transmembrane region/ABC transporter, putative [Angomonas deanei]